MSSITLTLPDDLQERAAAMAAAAGMSMDQYVATLLAVRLGAQAEAERFLAARAARATPGQARSVLARLGHGNPPWPGDEFDEGAHPEGLPAFAEPAAARLGMGVRTGMESGGHEESQLGLDTANTGF